MDKARPITRVLIPGLLSPALPIVIFLIFLVLASVLKFGIEREEASQVRADVAVQTQALVRELEQEFRAHRLALKRMAERRRVQPDLDENTWREDARNYLAHFGTYQAIEWIGPDFRIKWVEPMAGNEEVLGFNVAFSESRRQALAEAARTGTLDTSGVVDLKQGGTGVVLYEPIGAGNDNRGFIAGVFHMEKLVQSVNTPELQDSFQITVLEDGEPAYQQPVRGQPVPRFAQAVALDLPDVDWSLQLTPTRRWVQGHLSDWAAVTFATLALMGLLVSLTTLLAQLILKRNQALLRTRNELQQEIDQRKSVQQDLVRLETTDALTGLANRRFFVEDLAHNLGVADRQMRQLALIMIDLDRFQTLNDSLGHQFGDELLIQVSQRLSHLSNEGVMVAYSGGDEFMVCQQQVEEIDDVIHLLGQLQQCFARPFDVQGQQHSITATMGVAVYPQSGLEADTLLRNADVALYRAKEAGRNNYQFYTEGMQDREVLRLELDKDLSKALAQDEFVLFFQPQLNLATMQVSSVEALIRWQHPVRGLLGPMEFIPLAEESGRITEIGRWVVCAACRQLAQWRNGPLSHLRIAVNLSGRELDDEGLVDSIQQSMERYDIPADRLEVELTEEIFIANLERNLDQLTRLNKLGIHLAIDDFGVGYSSLAYLRDFPVDLLKIDRSFITRVTDRHDDAIITRAVINLAHNLGIQVAAEGIETEAQLNFLKNHRCDLAQGYLISRPIPAAELESLLARGLVFEDIVSPG